MKYNKLVFETKKVGSLWSMSDGCGNVYVSSSRTVLHDLAIYRRLHPEATLDELYCNFGGMVVFVR